MIRLLGSWTWREERVDRNIRSNGIVVECQLWNTRNFIDRSAIVFESGSNRPKGFLDLNGPFREGQITHLYIRRIFEEGPVGVGARHCNRMLCDVGCVMMIVEMKVLIG